MALSYYGKAEDAAKRIIQAFQHPETLPAALAPIFIRRRDNVPCRQWSWGNQLLTALMGFDDARGFRQWEDVGRRVKKGERAFPILGPVMAKRTRTNDHGETETYMVPVAFKSIPVFGKSQTEGDPLPDDINEQRIVDALPFVEVAREWGIPVSTYNGDPRAPQGKFARRLDGSRSIAIGVENRSTWAHELIHAADDRLGSLTEKGQHWRSETVAELGGAILLTMIGQGDDADVGGCWKYIEYYAKEAEIEPITACERVLKRTCDAVASIMDAAEALKPVAV